MLPGVPPSCRLAARGLPGKGSASGWKYLNSTNGSTSSQTSSLSTPFTYLASPASCGNELGELMPSSRFQSRSGAAPLLPVHCRLGREIGWVLGSRAPCLLCPALERGSLARGVEPTGSCLSELHEEPTPGSLRPALGHPTKASPTARQGFCFPPSEAKKKPVKEEWRKNELGRAMSPQLCGRQTLPTQLLPPRRRGRAVTGWGELEPPTAPTGTRTRGCRSSGLEHRTVAARRFYFQAKTRQHPLDKGC